MLRSGSPGDGHVPRNTRIALLAADIVQPYVCLQSVVSSASFMELEWYVGGAETVDMTFVTVIERPPHILADVSALTASRWNAIFDFLVHHLPAGIATRKHLRTRRIITDAMMDNDVQHNQSISEAAHTVHDKSGVSRVSAVQSGSARWGMNLHDHDPFAPPVFKTNVDFSELKLTAGTHWLVAWAAVDGTWGAHGQGFPKQVGPQSHVANARTNPAWHTSSRNHTVKGIRFWPSIPIAIAVAADGKVTSIMHCVHCAWWRSSTTGTASGREFIRSENTPNTNTDASLPSQEGSSSTALFLYIAIPIAILSYFLWQCKLQRQQHQIARSEIILGGIK